MESAFALGCAASRVFPLYSRKTAAGSDKNTDLVVEFVFVDNKAHKLSPSDVTCLTATAQSIRTAAKIVDMPCSEMHVNTFLDVSIFFGHPLCISSLLSIPGLLRTQPEENVEIHVSKKTKINIAAIFYRYSAFLCQLYYNQSNNYFHTLKIESGFKSITYM